MLQLLLSVFVKNTPELHLTGIAAILAGLGLFAGTKMLWQQKRKSRFLTFFLVLTDIIGSALLVAGTIWAIKWLATFSIWAAIGGGILIGSLALSAMVVLFSSIAIILAISKMGIKDVLKQKEPKKGTEL